MDIESCRLYHAVQNSRRGLQDSITDMGDFDGDQAILEHIQSDVRPRMKQLIDALQEYEAYLRRR